MFIYIYLRIFFAMNIEQKQKKNSPATKTEKQNNEIENKRQSAKQPVSQPASICISQL